MTLFGRTALACHQTIFAQAKIKMDEFHSSGMIAGLRRCAAFSGCRQHCAGHSFKLRGKVALCHSRIVIKLQPSPEAVVHAEVMGQPQPRINRDRTLACDDFADAALLHANIPGKAVCSDAHWDKKFFLKNFARGGVRNFAGHGVSLSVIVNDLNIGSIAALEPETYPLFSIINQ
jgi:hypothetical protein